MSQAAYDEIADEYAEAVSADSDSSTSVLGVATHCLLATIGPVANLDVCDLGCGEGHLARQIADRGGRVVGIDISERLLELARERTLHPNIRFILDDAQRLTTLRDSEFDLVVSNLALMDIPDLKATYATVHRILRAGGRFIFSITHPCFQAPDTNIDTDREGNFLARRIMRYAKEGFWRSDYTGGIRGKVGAYHRMLSTYINELILTGFVICRIIEPTLPPGQYENPWAQGRMEVPSVLVIESRRP
ncbi:MAG: class I SAM-dependent methyltransferase [Candidatus Zixiibacteriota bacterium]